MSGTLDNSTSWKPVGETPEEIFHDGVKLIAGTTTNDVAYGVVLTLYFMCMNVLIEKYREGTHRKRSLISGAYITVMFAAGTFYCAVNARESQLAYVDDRNFPGGPVPYDHYTFSTPFNVAGVVSFFLTAWMNDALLIWRLSVLYSGHRFSVLIIGFALITYLGTFAMGMVALIETVLPDRSFWSAISVKFVMAYYALTVAYTVLITALMVLRILLARHAFIKVTGSKGHGAQYLSIATMIIESSALYSVWGLIFLGLYIANNPIQDVFLATLSEVQIIAPMLIIYRVSTGKAWNSDTTNMLTKSGQHKAQEKSHMTAIVFRHTNQEASGTESTFGDVTVQNSKMRNAVNDVETV
ncbi:hypothetical protein CVT24_001387 [Panaeolus cyanescens]|uniref:Uncharacterized protein n=1 Tax=Panaeolus cyanescens TaxID=181874 RepID=A0A409YYU9_9AGAR|nr:hypothetical protein CVT24_001387 [Panaeolus cyanescens]